MTVSLYNADSILTDFMQVEKIRSDTCRISNPIMIPDPTILTIVTNTGYPGVQMYEK